MSERACQRRYFPFAGYAQAILGQSLIFRLCLDKFRIRGDLTFIANGIAPATLDYGDQAGNGMR